MQLLSENSTTSDRFPKPVGVPIVIGTIPYSMKWLETTKAIVSDRFLVAQALHLSNSFSADLMLLANIGDDLSTRL
ncbi:hypothetical protein [Pedobacter sp. V48]|uniref:hypothetical protein n=1 Tax=Pedobacter sp. V48 TaxID=509635 RepID=UPI0012694250|nr:hypothetical protein [Pedobacter sp. V48]